MSKRIDVSDMSLEQMIELREACRKGKVRVTVSTLRVLQSHIEHRTQIVKILDQVLTAAASS